MPWYLPDPPVVKQPRPAPMAVPEEPPFAGEVGDDAFGYPLRQPDRAVVLDALRARRFDLLERWMSFFQAEYGVLSSIYEVDATTFAVTKMALKTPIQALPAGRGGYNRHIRFSDWRIIGTVHAHDQPMSIIKVP
jgi:hypothetical protein